MRALALEHRHSNPVGVYGDVLLDRGIEIHRVRLDLGEALPGDWREYDLLVVMGGGMSVYEEDAYPWLVAEKRAIREAITTGCPYFGVCRRAPAAYCADGQTPVGPGRAIQQACRVRETMSLSGRPK
jgi:GMP synthase-like glutamine amidotransferase